MNDKNHFSHRSSALPRVVGDNKPKHPRRKKPKRSIVGASQIDLILLELCPNLLNKSEEKIGRIGDMVSAYLFGRKYIARLIEDETNSEFSEYIESIGDIIHEEAIPSIKEFEYYLEREKSAFSRPWQNAC